MHYEKKIIDDFLTKEENDVIFQTLSSNSFNWFLNKQTISGIKNVEHPFDFYFFHSFYEKFRPSSDKLDILVPILEKLECKALVRVKANFYPNTHIVRNHGFHSDQPYNLKSCLYYVNTNNGFTLFQDGTKVESVANRALLFNSFEPHCSSSTSDSKFRITINFNYF